MKNSHLVFFSILPLILLSSLIPPVSSGLDGDLYVEKIETYSYVDGEVLRWDLKREFLIRDYYRMNFTRNGEEIPGQAIEMTSDTQRGTYETIIQPLNGMNFEINPIYLSDGRVSEFRWSMYLFRNSSIYSGFPVEFFAAGNKHFDLENEPEFFNVNLEYFEYWNNSGNIDQIKVNTELSTKNYDDGRASRIAIHIIKRQGSDMIFEYNWFVEEVSTVFRYLNLLDQPALWIPLQLGSVFLLIVIYWRIHRYWVNNDMRIIKGKNKQITIVEIDGDKKKEDEEADKQLSEGDE